MNLHLFGGALAGVLAVCGAGCTFPSSKTVIPARQANQIQTTDLGKVVRVREVVIQGERTRLGQYGGAAIGGAAATGNGRIDNAGEALGVAGAAVAGAVLGEATEEYLRRVEALELTIELRDGSLITVTQAATPRFAIGDAVQVIHGPGGARVAPAASI